jgi:hypothetical protein
MKADIDDDKLEKSAKTSGLSDRILKLKAERA